MSERTMTEPRLSILMPSHRSVFLAQAVGSVLAQTSAAYQLLLDHTPGAVLGDRLNRLARVATGEWLVMLSDDDWLTSVFVEVLLAAADAHPEAGVIYSDCYASQVGEWVGERLVHVPMKPWVQASFATSAPCWITSLVRRRVWRDLGGHDVTLGYFDWDFYYRCFRAGVVGVHVPTPLWYYREHGGQWSHWMDRPAERAAVLARHPELCSTA